MSIDLWTPVVPPERQNPNFRAIIENVDRYQSSMDVISSWADGFVDRDKKFVVEFQTTFNSSFWELYLFACLKDMDYKCDFSHERPDFVLDAEGKQFCIEATTANAAVGQPSEWEIALEDIWGQLEQLDKQSLVDQATIRLAGSLYSKHKWYLKSYAALPHVSGKPFVLAVAPFEQPFFYLQTDQAIRRVLYGYDMPIYKDFPEENRREIYGHNFFPSIKKSNGTDLDLGFFTNDGMKEISAVLFSNTATMGNARALSSNQLEKVVFHTARYNREGLEPIHASAPKWRYKETLLDGLYLLLNPFAQYPLSEPLFQYDDIAFGILDTNTGVPYMDASDGQLLQRLVVKLVDDEDEQ